MSEDTYQIETRRRSRSKTPFLRSSCDHENCEHAGEEGHVHHLKKKSAAPNVQTIVEEHIVVSNSSKKTRGNTFAQLTSDYSSDDMTPEAKRKQSSITTTVTSILTKRSGGATSTPRNRSQLETTQNTLNSAQEKLNQSNGNLSSGNVSDYLAYIEYRDAGEYWNKTPKTDYTYSELSPHRRQLAPGIVAMPNMSRRSLENHNDRVNYMVQQNPAQEEFIRRRYQSRYTQQVNYDSADELDATFGQQKQSWWLIRLVQLVVSSVTTVWNRVTNLSASETTAYQNYYAKRQQSQHVGLWGKMVQTIGGGFASLLRYLYVFIGSVLSLDTWLLRSSEKKSKKRFLIFLLILLPLLLLSGLFYYIHPNETFPPKSLSEYTFTLPELPKIDVRDYLNQAQFESVRSQAAEHVVRVRDWADDYILYLRTIGQNVVNKGRQIFQDDDKVYYERV